MSPPPQITAATAGTPGPGPSPRLCQPPTPRPARPLAEVISGRAVGPVATHPAASSRRLVPATSPCRAAGGQPHLAVEPAGRQQLMVRPALAHPALVQHHDLVHLL